LLNVGIQSADKTALSSDKAAIEVVRLGENDQVLSRSQFNSAADNSTATPRLKFNSDVAVDGAKALLVNISYPGYATYSRRLAIQSLVYVDALLSKTPVSLINRGTFALHSGASVEGVQLVISDSLRLTIPNSLLPANTNLSAKGTSYDPNKPAEVIYFPGNYAAADGNKLMPVAFDFIALSTDSGAPLNLPAGAEPIWLSRSLPADSCQLLKTLGDANSELAGFQVPLYGFKSSLGLWEPVGEGTVYHQDGSVAASLACESGSYLLEGALTQAFSANQWLSFDYVQTLAQPAKFCAAVQINNQQGDSLAGIYGLINGQIPGQISPSYFTTDGQGAAHIEIMAADNAESIAAKLLVVNDGLVNEAINLTRNCTNPDIQTVAIKRPKLCQIQGRVTDDSMAPLVQYPVVAQAPSESLEGSFDFAITDSQGIYWLNVACKAEFTLKFTRFFAAESEVSGINVNGSVAANESTDDGQIASVINTKVTTVTTVVASAAYTLSTNSLAISVLSSQGNFPFSTKLQVLNADEQVLAEINGAVPLSAALGENTPSWLYGTGELKFTQNLGDGKGLKLRGSITDARGKVTQIGVAPEVLISTK